jgi:hypothetical protein
MEARRGHGGTKPYEQVVGLEHDGSGAVFPDTQEAVETWRKPASARGSFRHGRRRSQRGSESGYFKGWRRAEHADLWPVTLLIGAVRPRWVRGDEYDLTFLVAKNGVRAFWKSGALTSGD